jgi:AcrR family transcriptional regulator
MATAVAGVDRRRRRRQETIEEVLDLAVELMTEQGVAGLSVGEIARRMGIQPPSLYVYFPSKNALYDALFERGAQLVLDELESAWPLAALEGADVRDVLLGSARTFVGWCLEHPAYSQLLFWRPVPRFTPSPEAYAPAVRLAEVGRAWFVALQDAGLLRHDVAPEDLQRDWMVLIAGVVSQQLANAPDETLETGRFAAALPSLTAMFVDRYGAPPGRRRAPTSARRPTRQPRRGPSRHEDRS